MSHLRLIKGNFFSVAKTLQALPESQPMLCHGCDNHRPLSSASYFGMPAQLCDECIEDVANLEIPT